MANTVQLKKDGQIVYPITDRSCIIGLEEGPVMSCRYAWDGTTTPDVTKIPAGVTVEYNSNTYTGTLAASASTVGYQYLVYNPTSTEFDRYVTDATGGSYAWKAMGDTTIQSPDIADNLTTNDSTKALSAKQGKILNEELEGLDLKVNGPDTSSLVWSDGYVVGVNGEVTASQTSQFCQPYLLLKGDKISYKTGTTYNGAVVEVATDATIAVGDTLTIESKPIIYNTPNSAVEYTADHDMYIVISVQKASYQIVFTDNNSITKEIADIEQDLAEIKEDIEPLKTVVTVEITSNCDWSFGYVSNNRVETSSGTSSFCQPFKLKAGQTVKFGTTGVYSQVLVVVESGDAIEVGDIISPIKSFSKVYDGYQYVEYTATNDCYIICTGATASKNVWITIPGLVERVNDLEEQVGILGERIDTLESPGYYGNYTQFIGFKRAMQQVLLKWTPKNQVPKRDGTFFPGNVEVSGLIYGETMETDKRVGWDVSLLTFMTAVNNPYSLLYTENISATRSQSAYGITYHGDANSAAYYGSVCNTFAMLGVCNDISYTTPQIWERCTDLFFEVYDQSIRGLELMDLVGKNGHVLLVTKLVKDKYGVNVGVQLSEEAGTVAISRPVMNETQFASFLLANGYSVMRFKEQYKNIIYTPSPFVAVLDEVPEEYTYNNDICTIYGDYASILEGDLLHINYTKGAYTQMKIYKDDNLVETILLSSDASIHDIDLAEYGFTYGKYKACLSDGVNDSGYTHWELIRIEMSLSGDELTYSVNGGKALYWDWQKQNGGSYIPHLFDRSQEAGGIVDVEENGKGGYNYCIKVHAQGDYGRVAKKIIV